jgi:SAM-dependent methyltransferase
MTDLSFVQYGCGWSAPKGWRNFDASPTLRFERLPLVGRMYTKNAERFPDGVEYGDIVKGLPIPPESCDAVYCSHVLEHLSLVDFGIALRNTHLVLKPGGLFRCVLPDLEFEAKRYLENPGHGAALEFMRNTYLGQESRKRGLGGLLASWLGNSQHLWMWDYKSFEPALRGAGFDQVRRAAFGDSACQMFARVEERSRRENCLGVECRKPATAIRN